MMEEQSRQANSNENAFPRRVVVKFQNSLDLPYEDGVEKDFPEDMRTQWEELVKMFPGITLTRLYTTTSPDKIRELVNQATKTDPDYRPPNFLTYFVIDVPPEVDAFALAEALSKWDTVEYAYVESVPAPPPMVPTSSNPKLGMQRYLYRPTVSLSGSTDPGGIYAYSTIAGDLFGWGMLGGSGEGITFIDIEKGWILNHPDLVDPITNVPRISLIDGVNYSEQAHGTSVLGILAAQDNAAGCVGIAYKSTAKVVSAWQTTPAAPIWNIPNAIMSATHALTFGDVLLLELQLITLLPVELESANFAGIRLATALGIVVIEAAGNGSVSLTSRVNNLGKHIFDLSNKNEYEDSGAIMVGAADPLGNQAHRLPTSNYGDRVDCFAWGSLVTTTTDATDPVEDPDGDGYTSSFQGTSSASAIVAGAAIVAQGIAEQNLGYRLGGFQLRDLLKRTGTHPVSPPNQEIGVMPNLQAFINNGLYITPDVFVRDYIGDDGDPHTGAISASPDVIVRPAGSVANPDTAFGGSATFNNATLGSQVLSGQNHVLYVRVLNRGSSSASGTKATVYWAYPSTLVTPNTWTKIGTSASARNVSASTSSLTVLDPIPWPVTAIPGPGHYCFIATIGGNADPDPIPDPANLTSLSLNDFQNIIRRNNNVTWRNFNVVTMLTGIERIVLPFMVQGWLTEDLPMQLEVVARLPQGSKVWLEGPAEFMKMIVDTAFYLKDSEKLGVLQLPINPYGANRFKDSIFPAKLQADIRILVDIPQEERGNVYEIFARQLYHDEEVGRVTWRLVPPERAEVSGDEERRRIQWDLTLLNRVNLPRLNSILDKRSLQYLSWRALFILGAAATIIAIRNYFGRKRTWPF